MKYVLIILIIWLVIAFVYSRVKKCGFIKANALMLVGILKAVFSPNQATQQKMKQNAKQAGREDVVEKMQEHEDATRAIHEQLKEKEQRLKE